MANLFRERLRIAARLPLDLRVSGYRRVQQVHLTIPLALAKAKIAPISAVYVTMKPQCHFDRSVAKWRNLPNVISSVVEKSQQYIKVLDLSTTLKVARLKRNLHLERVILSGVKRSRRI